MLVSTVANKQGYTQGSKFMYIYTYGMYIHTYGTECLYTSTKGIVHGALLTASRNLCTYFYKLFKGGKGVFF